LFDENAILFNGNGLIGKSISLLPWLLYH